MSDGNAFVYTERDMRAIIQAERERIAQAYEAIDPVEWALWGQHGGVYAARIARRGGEVDE